MGKDGTRGTIVVQAMDDGDMITGVVGRSDIVFSMLETATETVAETMLRGGVKKEDVSIILQMLMERAIDRAAEAVEEQRKAGEGDDPKGTPEDPRP